METIKCLRYSLYVIFHPFDGFWDIKHEKRGNMRASGILVALTVLVYVTGRQFTGFQFNYIDPESLNFIVDIALVLLLYFLWCTANWCLTSLMDGKGNYKDIMMTSAYALTPYIILSSIAILLSFILTQEEGVFYDIILDFGYIWTAGLLFFGIMTTHQYSFWKNFVSVLLTIVGMAIILFIGLLFFSVIQQVVAFFNIIFKEISLRL